MQATSSLSVPGERIAVVDVLRAYALFGIIITHAAMGFLAGPAPGAGFHAVQPLDRVVFKLSITC